MRSQIRWAVLLAGILAGLSRVAPAVELPTQSCFSVSPDGKAEFSMFVMEDLQAPGARKNLRFKFGALKLDTGIVLMSDGDETGFSLPVTQFEIRGKIAHYAGTGFTLEIDRSLNDPTQGKTVLGKFDLDPEALVTDPATHKPASFKNKTVSCAKL